MLRPAALVLALVLAGLLAWRASLTPAPVPANAPATAFSAERAFADIEVVGARPHPTGSPANAKVRDYLVERLQGLGLKVRVQPGEAFETKTLEGETWALGARVENIVGVMAGRDPSLPALLVMSHYDSVPNSPGASDNAAGVASALETARALKAAGQPARDVVFLITDGEEAGLVGARAFWADDPLAKHVGAVVNMDTRGDGGRAYMFETGRGDGQTVARLAREGTRGTSNSLTTFIYSLLPNDTDFTVSKAAGLPGLNFAFIGRQFGYHAASSTPADLDKGSLQHMGEQTLAAARDFSQARPFPRATPDLVYSDVLGHGLVAYPLWAGWLVILASIALFGAAFWRATRSQPWSIPGVLRGWGAGLGLTLAVVPLADLARRLTGVPFGFVGERPLLAQAHLFEAVLAAIALAVVLAAAVGLSRGRGRFVLAAAPLAAGLACWPLGGLDLPALVCGVLAAVLAVFAFARPVSPWDGWTGVWKLAALATIAAQVFAPSIGFVFAWPLLAASVTALLIALSKGSRFEALGSVGVALVMGVLATAQIAYLTHAVIVGVGTTLPGAIAPFVFTAALVMFPLTRLFAQARGAGWAAGGAAALAMGGALFIGWRPYASPRTPQVSDVLAVADPARNVFRRVAPLDGSDPWTLAVLTADGGKALSEPLPPISDQPVRTYPAAPFAATAGLAFLSLDNNLRLVSPPGIGTDFGATSLQFSGGSARSRADANRQFQSLMKQMTDSFGRPPVIPAATPHRVALDVPAIGAQQLRVELETSVPVSDVRVDGKPVALLGKPGAWSHLIFAAPAGGVEVSFTPKSHGTLQARWAAITPGWPAEWKALPPRPANTMPWGLSDSTVVLGSISPGEGRF